MFSFHFAFKAQTFIEFVICITYSRLFLCMFVYKFYWIVLGFVGGVGGVIGGIPYNVHNVFDVFDAIRFGAGVCFDFCILFHPIILP